MRKDDAELDQHILYIVQNFAIKEQSELQNHLKARGYCIPQATLSRRLKKLKIAKVENQYQTIEPYQNHALPRVMCIKASDAGLVVLHTAPGQASGLAFFLDQKYVAFSAKELKNSPIIGTIAGDDTLLLIARSKHVIPEIIELLHQHFPYLA